MSKRPKVRQSSRGAVAGQRHKDTRQRPTNAAPKVHRTPVNTLRNWLRSPWIIAVLAPVLTAAIFGIVKIAQARYEASTNPFVTAYANYDPTANGTWLMSAEKALDSRFFSRYIRTCDTMRSLLLASGGADTPESSIRLHLVGTQNGTVTISGVQAEIISRTPAKPVAIIGCPSAGTVATPQVALDLRQAVPTALSIIPSSGLGDIPGTDGSVHLGGQLGKPYFRTNIITLTKGEPFDIPITAFVAGSDLVRWRLVVDVEQNGSQQQVNVTGPVFATAPVLCHSVYAQNWTFQWDLVPPRLVHTTNEETQLCAGNTLPY